jgi:hypothetical protein
MQYCYRWKVPGRSNPINDILKRLIILVTITGVLFIIAIPRQKTDLQNMGIIIFLPGQTMKMNGVMLWQWE